MSSRLQLVKRLFEVTMSDGALAALALVPEDVVWRPFASGETLQGRASLEAYFSDLERRGGRVEAYPATYEERGEHVLVTGSARHYPSPSGFRESSLVWVFSFAGDRLLSQACYPTRAEAHAAIARDTRPRATVAA
jgi:ketosteroid isomerase-like protein